MGAEKRQSTGRGCGRTRERKRSVNRAAAPATRRHYLEPEDFEIVEGVDTSPIEPYLRGCWCSAETDLETEDSH